MDTGPQSQQLCPRGPGRDALAEVGLSRPGITSAGPFCLRAPCLLVWVPCRGGLKEGVQGFPWPGGLSSPTDTRDLSPGWGGQGRLLYQLPADALQIPE